MKIELDIELFIKTDYDFDIYDNNQRSSRVR